MSGYFDEWGAWHDANPPDLGNSGPMPSHWHRAATTRQSEAVRPSGAVQRAHRPVLRVVRDPEPVMSTPTTSPEPEQAFIPPSPPKPAIDRVGAFRALVASMRHVIERSPTDER